MVLLSITRLFILSINNANEMRYKILTLGYLDSYRNKDGKEIERGRREWEVKGIKRGRGMKRGKENEIERGREKEREKYLGRLISGNYIVVIT